MSEPTLDNKQLPVEERVAPGKSQRKQVPKANLGSVHDQPNLQSTIRQVLNRLRAMGSYHSLTRMAGLLKKRASRRALLGVVTTPGIFSFSNCQVAR